MFVAKIIKNGNSFNITIPSNLVKFMGLNHQDQLRVYIKKEVKKMKTNNHNAAITTILLRS